MESLKITVGTLLTLPAQPPNFTTQSIKVLATTSMSTVHTVLWTETRSAVLNTEHGVSRVTEASFSVQVSSEVSTSSFK